MEAFISLNRITRFGLGSTTEKLPKTRIPVAPHRIEWVDRWYRESDTVVPTILAYSEDECRATGALRGEIRSL